MRRLLVLCVLVAVSMCGGRPRGAAPTPTAASDYDVHRAVLEYWARKSRAGETLYVAAEEPARFASEAAAEAWADSGGGGMMRSVPPGMLRAYASANAQRVQVSVPGYVRGRRVVVTTANETDVPGRPRYVLSMSRPGYSARGDSAVVLVSRTCGMLCGTTAMLLAVRGVRDWEIQRELWAVLH